MKYTLVFLAGGAALLALAALSGEAALVLAWPGLDLLVLAGAYGLNRPSWLGKRPDGSMSPGHTLLLLPYLLLTWGTWHLYRRLAPEDRANEVAPGIWVGRRPLPGELPAGVALLVDMTAEFPVAVPRSEAKELVLLPTLDARAPAPDELRRVAARAAACDGPVYIHCAAGHGRSATLAATILVLRGDAPDLRAAEELMRRTRPSVRLHAAQRRAAEAALLSPRP